MRKEKPSEHQLSFLSPDDALLLHQFRLFMAEASRIYEARTGKSLDQDLTIRNPQGAYDLLRLEMEDLEQEQLRVINLNTRNRVISVRIVYQGSVNSVAARAAEIFRPAIKDNAQALIMVHNHPSGDPTPSPEDVMFTQQLKRGADLLDLDLLDHIIIGKGRFVSLKERGLGFDVESEHYPTSQGNADNGRKRQKMTLGSSPPTPSA